MMLSETARAKVNLTLEVLGRRPDGYHELRSLVAFADYGDTLRLETPSAPFSLEIDGPFAAALEGRNLVQAAVEHYVRVAIETSGEGKWPDADAALLADKAANSAYRDAQPASVSGARDGMGDSASGGEAPLQLAENRDASPRGVFRLTKRIPVAAGLGGGSADAAAALRLLSRMTREAQPLERLLPSAAQLGADVPVCLLSKPAMMTGIGERLTLLPGFPKLPALLVNPRLPLATAAVFRELRAAPLEGTSIEEAEPAALQSLDAVLDYAKQRRNDLEAPACRLLPAVGAILACLERTPGVVLARLSGSGPTCFALFREWHEAEAAARRLRSEHAGWWIEAVTL